MAVAPSVPTSRRDADRPARMKPQQAVAVARPIPAAHRDAGRAARTRTCRRRAACAAGAFCVAGAGAAVVALWALGFFTFDAPCLGLEEVRIGDIEVDWAASLLGSPSGTIQADIVVSANNTNPYDLTYEHTGHGEVFFRGTEIGGFDITDGTLRARAETLITARTKISAGPGLIDFQTISSFMTGGAATLMFRGTIKSEGPLGLSGLSQFECNATLRGIVGAYGVIDCYNEFVIGDRRGNVRASASTNSTTPERCYV